MLNITSAYTTSVIINQQFSKVRYMVKTRVKSWLCLTKYYAMKSYPVLN